MPAGCTLEPQHLAHLSSSSNTPQNLTSADIAAETLTNHLQHTAGLVFLTCRLDTYSVRMGLLLNRNGLRNNINMDFLKYDDDIQWYKRNKTL